MEASAGRGGSVAVPPSQHPQRREWRAVSEFCLRNNGSEESGQAKSGQTDERTIYEQGIGSVEFSSISIDREELKEDILQRRLQEVSSQREELQQMEIELRAVAIARSGIMEMQNSFRNELKEQADITAKLKEQLHEREQEIHELELKLAEKERELQAVKIDSEAVWAKEDLFREQNKELAIFRRERDTSEAEKVQNLKTIHDLQDHIREKENQFHALEEQHRIAQETVLHKDEQLREMQAWMAHVQEVDALQTTTNQSLQAELRNRVEQFNQYWIALQQQFAEMERYHLQTIQQLRLELAEARGRNGTYKDGSLIPGHPTNSSPYLQNKGNSVNTDDGARSKGVLEFGSDEKLSVSISPAESERIPAVSSVLGMGAFLPTGQMSALHPFVMYPQGLPQSASSTQVGNALTVSAGPAQHLQQQQEVPVISPNPNPDNYHTSNSELDQIRSRPQYNHEVSADGRVHHQEKLGSHLNQQMSPTAGFGVNEHLVVESNGKAYQVPRETQGSTNSISYHDTELLELSEQKNDHKSTDSAINVPQEKGLNSNQTWAMSNTATSAVPSQGTHTNSVKETTETKLAYNGTSNPKLTNKRASPVLLDEGALLACIVRAIPAGSAGRIRISTTLTNRLAKMLVPFHWNDYKKHYGKLDDFVARHTELFVIEGDHIHLREGAQEIISATAAVAKVAAAAVSAPYSSLFPSVAVTPVSQSNRHRKALSVNPNPLNSASFSEGSALNNNWDSSDKYTQVPKARNQSNGISYDIVQGLSDVTLSNSTKNSDELHGLQSEVAPGQSTINNLTGNGSLKN
ncbi:hypothetical protein HPP92_020547 [Vanilla planifolia]|uniref:DUF7725 domain-containing protein n=1 Tax=Vanilla planifolia TaxID=51239 RepID=A0A835UJW1_VANPL|nr:hypothetical protein HPP92_020547 [Vanilla planifolia]